MLTYVALTIGVVGLLLAWWTSRKNHDLQERIAQVNSRVYHLRREMQEAQEKAHEELMGLKFQLLQLRGELQVTPEMRIGEIVALHPQAGQVLAGFHLGGCSSCSVDERQTLGEAAAVNGREVAPIVVALNSLLEGNGAGPASPEGFRTPNVQLHF